MYKYQSMILVIMLIACNKPYEKKETETSNITKKINDTSVVGEETTTASGLKYIDEIIVKGRSHPVKTFQVKDLTPNETESNDLNYETDGFSVILDEEKIKNKNEIIDHLEKSLDHLKK